MNTLNLVLENAETLVEDRLDRFFGERMLRAHSLGPRYEQLWHAIAAAAHGGKRFRPALVLGVHRDLGGSDLDVATSVATGYELLHTAFLLHDDVIDRDDLRRGVPNLPGLYAADARRGGIEGVAAERWGQAAAILAGDLLIHAAQGMIARLTVDEATRLRLLELLDESVFVTAAGELADVALCSSVDEPDLAFSLAMTEWKTAEYSFAAPLQSGAVLAGADEALVAQLGRFGRHLGSAFQLRDDLLGVFGDEAITGKSTVSDLIERKKTPLMSFALQTAHGEELARILARPALTPEDCVRLRRTLVRAGARDFVELEIEAQLQQATASLHAAEMPQALRARLNAVARHAVERAQ